MSVDDICKSSRLLWSTSGFRKFVAKKVYSLEAFFVGEMKRNTLRRIFLAAKQTTTNSWDLPPMAYDEQ